MLFNSFPFLYLVLITLLVYYTPFLKKFQVKTLIISSFVFYAFHYPTLLLLLIASAGINIVSSYYVTYGKGTHQKRLAALGVVSNLAILAFFKYSPLFAKTFLPEGSSIGAILVAIPLPIGISFFTFQGISLMIDVYKGNYFQPRSMVPRDFWRHTQNTVFFIGFFPQLIAGPIVKSHEFLPQIQKKTSRILIPCSCFKIW
jgi:alginate O-acetyltransferase complex protein AlgI